MKCCVKNGREFRSQKIQNHLKMLASRKMKARKMKGKALEELPLEMIGEVSSYLTWKGGRYLQTTSVGMYETMRNFVRVRLVRDKSVKYIDNKDGMMRARLQKRVLSVIRQLDGYYKLHDARNDRLGYPKVLSVSEHRSMEVDDAYEYDEDEYNE